VIAAEALLDAGAVSASASRRSRAKRAVGTRGQPPHAAPKLVSRFFARIGSPCLGHGVHGASIAAFSLGNTVEHAPLGPTGQSTYYLARAPNQARPPRSSLPQCKEREQLAQQGAVVKAQLSRAHAHRAALEDAAGGAPGGSGESFLRAYWVAVPETWRARRVNSSCDAAGGGCGSRGGRRGGGGGAE
jgi:hypothetical protein